jgi:hypothetical protein
MNRDTRNKIYSTITQLNEELDKSYELQKTLNFDRDFPTLITTTTRIKILKEFIELFKLMKNYNTTTRVIILERTSILTKRVKLHFFQLKRLKDNLEDNTLFFTTLLRVLLSLTINKKN